ncbi:MAG: DoxX family protein [Acidimicrobiales bacterium]
MQTDIAALGLRLAVGAIFVSQGWRKTFAPGDAPHGRRALAQMLRSRGFPWPEPLARLTGVGELTCGTCVAIGFKTRGALAPLSIILGVAIGGFKAREGFIGGWDWPMSVLSGCTGLLVIGPGRLSVDALLVGSRRALQYRGLAARCEPGRRRWGTCTRVR